MHRNTSLYPTDGTRNYPQNPRKRAKPATSSLDATKSLLHGTYTLRSKNSRRSLLAHVVSVGLIKLCIYQDSEQEKNEQVILMSQIYERASVVYVWLFTLINSTPVTAVEEAVTFLQQLSTRPKLAEDWTPEVAQSIIQLLEQYPSYVEGDRSADATSTRATLPAIENILGSGWYQRSWVYQEASGSGPVVFFCGAATCHLTRDQILAALNTLNRFRAIRPNPLPALMECFVLGQKWFASESRNLSAFGQHMSRFCDTALKYAT
jgi:hypothetical protein